MGWDSDQMGDLWISTRAGLSRFDSEWVREAVFVTFRLVRIMDSQHLNREEVPRSVGHRKIVGSQPHFDQE